MRRDAPRLGIDYRRLGGLAELNFVTLMAREVEMGGPRRLCQRGAPRMAHQPRQFGGQVDGGRELGHRREKRCVRDFLVRVAMLKRRRLAARQRNHRGAPQKGILQSGGQIGSADRLRHAHPRPPGNPGIAVGHISRRLFRMREDRGHPEIPQLEQCAAQHQLHKEYMRRLRPGQRPRQPFGAVHRSVFTHLQFLPKVAPLRPRGRRGRSSSDDIVVAQPSDFFRRVAREGLQHIFRVLAFQRRALGGHG